MSRTEALRRLQLRARDRGLRDDDGGLLNGDADTEVFAALLPPPKNRSDSGQPLNFRMNKEEREFLRDKLRVLPRPGDAESSLLARWSPTHVRFSLKKPLFQTPELDRIADEPDRVALGLARDAAELAAIGRTVYGALVEQLRADDGCSDESTFRTLLAEKVDRHGRGAMRFNISSARRFLPSLPGYLVVVLEHTQAIHSGGRPYRFP